MEAVDDVARYPAASCDVVDLTVTVEAHLAAVTFPGVQKAARSDRLEARVDRFVKDVDAGLPP